MSLYAIADLHLSLGTKKPMDIFEGWQDYVERLEANWRARIRPEDTVVVPGDISWAMSLEETKSDFAFLESLPGRKVLMKGNHDYWWATMAKMRAFLAQNGFASLSFVHNTAYPVDARCVCGTRGWFYDSEGEKKVLLREAGRLHTSICEAEKQGLEPVVFLHYPPIYKDFTCAEITDVLAAHGITRCYYGHLHGRARRYALEGLHGGIRYTLISADQLKFDPLLIE
ncbi:metallophosphoesterase [Ethanoligenens harbinense]|uniref:Metallophosphoesterase n=1 Tax=Ethanoligenens harbinense (strain DSM 18485 / JCM 12961 / CGMCC 1.5033 / YUAN-3) TaxID=663278 RepID=E6U8M7_ETHHY|nr:metallophosphoesterase [Ethanoligenens harbinense]ADU26018.1 metallophosphoesterase [Ethanoligenens harbinense YUAN-3]AVQ95165.1 serine/threonine protein phosphatase [Ethanoligenens harbinense YUAN-3]AYF37855.1 serine/threonine protein phosphatase [Ethanoligenens harbinense]AYF40578.1 serine/threonine protein phosphatase [Ethanoligenens harbinense]QCN91411.1 serine/threonine protein phosphatase [Ethanoligenens harbinense]